MDKRVEEIVSGLLRLLKVTEMSFVATIQADKGDLVDVKDLNGTLYPDVRKTATKGKIGIKITPTPLSYVLVSRISNSDDLFVELYSEIESIEIMGGTNGGMVKVADLVQKLNALENEVNNLKTAISTWVPVASDGGAALKAALTTWFGQSLTLTVSNDLANIKFKH